MFVSAVGLFVSLVDQLHISQCGTKGQRTAHPIEGGTSAKTFKTMPRQCSKVKLYKLKCGMLHYQHLGTEHFSGLDLNKFDEIMDERYGKSQFLG